MSADGVALESASATLCSALGGAMAFMGSKLEYRASELGMVTWRWCIVRTQHSLQMQQVSNKVSECLAGPNRRACGRVAGLLSDYMCCDCSKETVPERTQMPCPAKREGSHRNGLSQQIGQVL